MRKKSSLESLKLKKNAKNVETDSSEFKTRSVSEKKNPKNVNRNASVKNIVRSFRWRSLKLWKTISSADNK